MNGKMEESRAECVEEADLRGADSETDERGLQEQ